MDNLEIISMATYLKDRFEGQKEDILAGIKSPYWDNETYHWYVDQLDCVEMVHEDDAIAILQALGYGRKLILKTYGNGL